MREPTLTLWLQDSVPPRSFYDIRPGHWVAEPAWPSPNIQDRRWSLAPGRLTEAGSGTEDPVLVVRSPESTGIASGEWCPFGLGGVGAELPLDQRLDDGGSLNFDSAPLTEPLAIVGAPVLDVTLSSDKPRANLIARMSDVAPDGASTRVTYGVLNLAHRESHEFPAPLEPGRRYAIRLPLNEIAHVFPKSHRLRLSISTAYWPILFPSPDRATLSLATGASSFSVPVRPARPEDATPPTFGEAEGAAPLPVTELRPAKIERTIRRDVDTGEVEYAIHRDDGRVRLEHSGTVIETVKANVFRVRDDDPLAAESRVSVVFVMERPDWHVEVRSRATLTGDSSHFRLVTDCDVFDAGARIYSRTWDHRIPRGLV
jgi:hypothetical protein